MDIIKIIGIGLIGLIIIILLKQYKPEFAIYVSLAVGIMILVLVLEKFTRNYFTNKITCNKSLNKF